MKSPATTMLIAATIVVTALAITAPARQVKLNVSMSNPFLKAAEKQTTYLKVGLAGFEMADTAERAQVNVALVIDKSGSMQGAKIQKAKEAALMAVDRLRSDDIVSVIAYDSTVTVLVPATKVSDRATIRRGINSLRAGGSTALFAGVSRGANEVRKFLEKNQVNRVLLLSDGLANVGPDSPGALGELGASLGKEGMTVTTVGLGNNYNEDLMTQLAGRSDGNHAFAEGTTDLARIFNHEFGDILSVVAQEVVVTIDCAPGIRPVRVFGRDAEISGRRIITTLNQLYSTQEKYVLVEVEVSSEKAGRAKDVAKVEVSYANMQTKTTDALTSTVAVRFTEDAEKVAQSTKSDVMVSVVLHVATEKNKMALELRDRGRVAEAEKVLAGNVDYLAEHTERYKSETLKEYYDNNRDDMQNLDEKNWTRQRKRMLRDQYYNDKQMQYK
jgi:Ca-activated chloride channel homolog